MSGCKLCKEPESLPSKPLIKCSRCHVKRWHAHCAQPPVDPRNIPKEWKCKTCKKETITGAGQSMSSAPSNARPGPSSKIPSESLINIRGTLCNEPGCMTPVFQSNLQLCPVHKIQLQHKKATAAMKPAIANTASGSKPIQKKSLYNFKIDDSMKHLKRKRPSPAKRSSSDNALPVVTGEGVITQRLSSHGTDSFVSAAFHARSTPMRTPQQRAAQFNLLAGAGSDRTPDDMNISVGSASMVESPISLINADLDGDYLMPHSARRTPQTQPTTSPEYSPPPALEMPPNELNNLWAEPTLDRSHSPGSQIDQELRAIADQPDDSVTANSLGRQLPPIILAPTSAQDQRKRESSTPTTDEDAHVGDQEDNVMPDAAAVLEGLSLPKASSAAALISPLPPLMSISSITTPEENIAFDGGAIIDSLDPEILQSLEAKRKQNAAIFDTSVIDFFLTRQTEAEVEPDLQPTPQELAQTQIWGHINPDKVWPKETSEDWLAEKRREIDARGGRKANYGKLLTAQVRKERNDLGWQLHQNSEAVPDWKMRETERHVEELFGIKGIDDLIPGVRNAGLVMMELPVHEDGRKKRKVKVYPVL